ncbi:putative disease resistance protein RGA1 [Papaver somniferum]|uniref:putative disease resistance protein RGA1 n=1 Tax=Papaver somniferum TaxID=3469 RepID=UPI000E6FB741|nr:putative disease resistance protein RGA1 [Papaver somniferum]
MTLEGTLVNGVTEILKKLLPVISQQIGQAWDVKDDLKKLGKTLESIQALISDAEEKQITDATVRLWFTRLKDVVYDADDLMDEFCYESMSRCERGSQLKHKCLHHHQQHHGTILLVKRNFRLCPLWVWEVWARLR